MNARQSEAFWNAQLQTSVIVPNYESYDGRYKALSEASRSYGAPERIAHRAGPDAGHPPHPHRPQ